MSKKSIERSTIALLFTLVLIVFSLAEKDSKKLEKLYTTTQLIKKGSQALSDVAAEITPATNSNK
jgi:hypothetical protein